MKKISAVVTALVVTLASLAFAANEEKAAKAEKAAPAEKAAVAEKAAPGEFKTFAEKLSYALGMEIGTGLKELEKELDFDVLLRGLKDGFKGSKSVLSEDETGEVKKEFMKKMQAQRMGQMKEATDKNIKEGAAFLAENKKKKGVVTTKSGLQYIVEKEGEGPKPTENDQVTVNYRGTLLDETEFDSSYKRGQPATFPVNGVIAGWTEALQLMKPGSKYKLFVPAELAYGETGNPPRIGPNAVLIFEIELLKVEKSAEKPAAAPGALPPGHPAVK